RLCFRPALANPTNDHWPDASGSGPTPGVSRKAVGGWEAGESYPKAEHLKELMTLAMRASAFPAGREEEEIRALWKAAHQKVLLDEVWLSTLLHQPSSPPTPVPVEETSRAEEGSVPTPPASPCWSPACRCSPPSRWSGSRRASLPGSGS